MCTPRCQLKFMSSINFSCPVPFLIMFFQTIWLTRYFTVGKMIPWYASPFFVPLHITCHWGSEEVDWSLCWICFSRLFGSLEISLLAICTLDDIQYRTYYSESFGLKAFWLFYFFLDFGSSKNWVLKNYITKLLTKYKRAHKKS